MKHIWHNSQTVKASYTKLSVFFRLPIPLDLRYFRAKSDVWGVQRRLRETGGSRRKYLKTCFFDKNTPETQKQVIFDKNTPETQKRVIFMQKYNFFIK